MGFGNAPSQSTNAMIENVYIHDLAISPLEKLKFKTNPLGGATRGPVADVFDIMKVADQWDDISTAKYIGTAYSDVQIAMSQFEKSWYVLDHTCFDEGIVAWALDGVSFADTYYGGCNTDIQLHINKGVIGLRIDNIVGFNVNNVRIENLVNTGVLGTETDVCGPAYTQGNAHQDPLITAGYTGTEGYGVTITQSTDGSLTDVSIKNLETHYGFATGVALFKDSSVEFAGDLLVDNIIAGSQMQMEYLRPELMYLPNKIPIACSVFDNNYNTEYTLSGTITATNINGYLMCTDDAMIGECSDESCTALYEQTYFDELSASYTNLREDSLPNTVWNLAESQETDTVYASFSKSLIHVPTYAIIAFTVLMIIALFMCYRWSSPYSKIKDETTISKAFTTNEFTPLLN